VLVTWMSRWASRRDGAPRTRSVVLFVLVLICLAMVVAVVSEGSWQELATADVSKLEIVRQAFRIVPAFPIFGIGRGAFESVFPDFRTEVVASNVTFTHPENLVAQWTTEWGVVVSVAALISLLFALRPTAALARSHYATGSWAALACLGVHNLVDFSSEFPGVMVALAVCAAIVTGGSRDEGAPKRLAAWATYPRTLALAGAAAAALGVALVLPGRARELHDDKLAIRESALDAQVPSSVFRSKVRAMMFDHPADPLLPFMGGLRAERMREGSVLPWVGRTLARARVYGPAHLLLARALRSTSPAQARFEYRMALEQGPDLDRTILQEILPLVHGYDDARELAVTGSRRAVWLELLLDQVRQRLPATAARLDADLLQLQPDSLESLRRHAQDSLADLRGGEAASWCSGSARGPCVDEALAQTTKLVQLVPMQCASLSLRAQALIETGSAARGVDEFLRGAEQATDRAPCLKEVVGVASHLKMDDTVTRALDEISHSGCVDSVECTANQRFVAGYEEARGNPRRALAILQRARNGVPEDESLLIDIGRLASRLEMHAEALGAYEELARRHPGSAQWQAAISSEREALVKGSIKL
jgi:tetratricopeptide (TPR) repeat protein